MSLVLFCFHSKFFCFYFCSQLSAAPAMTCFSELNGLSSTKDRVLKHKAQTSEQKQVLLSLSTPLEVCLVQPVQLFWLRQCPNIVRSFITHAKTRYWGALMMVKLNFNPYYNSICFNKECVIRTLYFLSDMLKNNMVRACQNRARSQFVVPSFWKEGSGVVETNKVRLFPKL